MRPRDRIPRCQWYQEIRLGHFCKRLRSLNETADADWVSHWNRRIRSCGFEDTTGSPLMIRWIFYKNFHVRSNVFWYPYTLFSGRFYPYVMHDPRSYYLSSRGQFTKNFCIDIFHTFSWNPTNPHLKACATVVPTSTHSYVHCRISRCFLRDRKALNAIAPHRKPTVYPDTQESNGILYATCSKEFCLQCSDL
jgi:hypothetical protein